MFPVICKFKFTYFIHIPIGRLQRFSFWHCSVIEAFESIDYWYWQYAIINMIQPQLNGAFNPKVIYTTEKKEYSYVIQWGFYLIKP